MSFQLVPGGHRLHIVGCYLVPYNALTNRGRRCGHQPAALGSAMLVIRYVNTKLVAPEGQARDEDIAADMVVAGLEYFSWHFLPRHKPWLKDRRTWCMLHGGREVRSLS